MRKVGLLLFITALLGSITFWVQRSKIPNLESMDSSSNASTVLTPKTNSTPQPDFQEKKVPKAAPFVRPAPQVVPPEALSQSSSYPNKQRRNEAVEYSEIYPTVDELVLVTLDAALGRTAAYQSSLTRSHLGWEYICGRPLEMDGSAFDYTRSRLKSRIQTGSVEDMFCLLAVSLKNGFELKEFSLGASDNPMEGWAEKHRDARILILGAIE